MKKWDHALLCETFQMMVKLTPFSSVKESRLLFSRSINLPNKKDLFRRSEFLSDFFKNRDPQVGHFYRI